jgi:hypothetical protein
MRHRKPLYMQCRKYHDMLLSIRLHKQFHNQLHMKYRSRRCRPLSIRQDKQHRKI